MRALTILAFVVPFALPAQAKDGDDLSGWSVEELCENKDKRKHAEAVFAEFERRGTFRPFEIELIREGRIDIGASEAALHCSWGEPRATEAWNGEPWQVYYRRVGSQNWRLLLRIDSALVAEIRPDFGAGPGDYGVGPGGTRTLVIAGGLSDSPDTFSGRRINSDGTVSDPIGTLSSPYDAGRAARASEAERASQSP